MHAYDGAVASGDGLTEADVPSSLVISHDSFIHMTRFPARARFVSIAELRPIDAPAVPSSEGVERLRQSVWRLFPELQGRLIADDGKARSTHVCDPSETLPCACRAPQAVC